MGKFFAAIAKYLLTHPEVVTAVADAVTKHKGGK